jgi:hypothetical protein
LLACLLACYTNSRDDQIFSHLILTFCKEFCTNHDKKFCVVSPLFYNNASLWFYSHFSKFFNTFIQKNIAFKLFLQTGG